MRAAHYPFAIVLHQAESVIELFGLNAVGLECLKPVLECCCPKQSVVNKYTNLDIRFRGTSSLLCVWDRWCAPLAMWLDYVKGGALGLVAWPTALMSFCALRWLCGAGPLWLAPGQDYVVAAKSNRHFGTRQGEASLC